MSGHFNRVILVGRIAGEVSLGTDGREELVSRFSLITELRLKGRQGTIRETSSHPIVAWGELARLCGSNLVEGRLALVEGRLRACQAATGYEIRAEQVRFLDEPE